MEDRKHRPTHPDPTPSAQGQSETTAQGARRRLSRIVHDHKGTARVEWQDAPPDHVRQVFEIEGARASPSGTGRSLDTGSLAVNSEDTHNPYMRIPEADRQRGPNGRTDLRKLSAWIKMMRELEEAKKRNGGDED
jgi:hypothetical protein